MFDELRDLAVNKLDTRAVEGSSKVMPLDEAIRRFVRPGMMLHVCNSPGRPCGATFELLRQFRGQQTDFTLVLNSLNTLFGGSSIVRSGLFKKVVCCYAGAGYPSPGPSKVCQNAVKEGQLEFEHWSLASMAARLKAGAFGVPFTTTRSLIDSSMAEWNSDSCKVVEDPFFSSGERVAILKALNPDISFVHGLAADVNGNILIPPPLAENTWGAMAAKEGVIATVERIVDTDYIRQHNHFGRLPSYFVRSVSVLPFGVHPCSLNSQDLPGIEGYAEDYQFQIEVREADQTTAGTDAWADKWVYSVKNHQEYLDLVGFERLMYLRGKNQPDSYQHDLESLKARIKPGAEYNEAEQMIAVASRMINQIIRRKGYKAILAGIGASNLAAWIANVYLKEAGVDIDLMAEIGFYGYTPRPGDPFIFNPSNISTCKALADIEQTLGIFAAGGQNSCLGSLGAGQVDKYGNINSTFIPPNLLLVGSGGANDTASGCREVVITTVQSRSRFLDKVPYITSPGRVANTLVSQLGVYEKLGDDKEFTLTGYQDRPDMPNEETAVRLIKEQCGWELKVAPKLRRYEGPTLEELRIMRMYDPRGQFIGD